MDRGLQELSYHLRAHIGNSGKVESTGEMLVRLANLEAFTSDLLAHLAEHQLIDLSLSRRYADDPRTCPLDKAGEPHDPHEFPYAYLRADGTATNGSYACHGLRRRTTPFPERPTHPSLRQR